LPFHFSEKLNLPLTIFFFTFIVFYFSLTFLQYDVFKSLIFSLLFLEASFLIQFLPTSFFLRLTLLFTILFFALKFDIIEKLNKENGSYSNRY
jgi:signal transduction histidine kinase